MYQAIVNAVSDVTGDGNIDVTVNFMLDGVVSYSKVYMASATSKTQTADLQAAVQADLATLNDNLTLVSELRGLVGQVIGELDFVQATTPVVVISPPIKLQDATGVVEA